MAAKGGAEHHNVVRLREDKAKVLASVETGIEVRVAISMAGRKPDVLKKWLTDPVFAKDLEIARTKGSDLMKVTLGSENGKNIDFATFSKEFLGTKYSLTSRTGLTFWREGSLVGSIQPCPMKRATRTVS